MSKHDDDICDDVKDGDDAKDGDDHRARWNRCIFGSVFSITAGIILGTVGTVVMASEMPVLVGTGVGVSMAAAYCGKTYTGGGSKSEEDDEEDDSLLYDDEEDDDDYCKCSNRVDDTADIAEQEDEEEDNSPEDEPCSTKRDFNGYRCTCSCIPNPEADDE